MKLALIASFLVMSIALNAQTLQGKVVRVYDGDTITVLDEAKMENKVRFNRVDAKEEGQYFGDVVMTLLQWGQSLCASGDWMF